MRILNDVINLLEGINMHFYWFLRVILRNYNNAHSSSLAHYEEIYEEMAITLPEAFL